MFYNEVPPACQRKHKRDSSIEPSTLLRPAILRGYGRVILPPLCRGRIKNGFTLFESIIAIAIGAVILSALATVFIAGYNLYTNEHVRTEMQVSLVGLMRNIQEIGAGATTIISSRQFDGTTYTTGDTTIIFEVPSLDASGNILSEKDYVVFYPNPSDTTKLLMRTDAAATSVRRDGLKLLSEFLQTIQFRYNTDDPTSATLAGVFIALQKQIKDRVIQVSGNTTMLLRNK